MDEPQRRRDLLDLGGILALWAAAIAMARPYGNFPLDDDWDFAIATWRFAETGAFHFTKFTAVSLRAQVIWGAAWARLFGESFNVLRAATLTLSLLLIAVVFFTLRRAGVSRSLRAVATIAFAFHPIFFWASCSYMTEVPFVFASAVALLLFYRALGEDRLDLLFAAGVAVVVSWFVRQTGVTNLFAPLALLCILRGRLTPRWKQFAAVISGFLLLFVVLLVFKREWLSGSTEEFANHFKMWREETFRTPEQIGVLTHYSAFNAQNVALFFLPFSAALLFPASKRRRWDYALLGFIALIVAACVQGQIEAGQPLPYRMTLYNCCDTLVDWGLGQQTLSDVWRWKLTYPFHLTYGARLLLTWGSAALGALLMMHILTALFRDERLFVKLTAATAIAGTAALFGSGLYTDRYSFDSAWSIGLFLPLIVDWGRRRTRVVVLACLIAVAVFDVLAIQEYFAWNRARWSALDALRARGVPIEQIDAGSEPFNFFEVSKMTQRERRRAVIGFKPRPYALTYQPVPGFAVIDRHPYFGWLAWREGAIYTLRSAVPPAPVRPGTALQQPGANRPAAAGQRHALP